MTGLAARVVPRALALVLCWALFAAAAPDDVGGRTRAGLAAGFRFTDLGWVDEPGDQAAVTRAVNPSLAHIQAWISSVGAAVALGDIDGDGLDNDVCTVDPRTDAVTITGVPGDNARFSAFELRPAMLPYDDSTAPMGCVLGDVDEDSTTDVIVYYWGRSPVLFTRLGGTKLAAGSYVAQELNPAVPRWFTNAALLADFDGDGHQDVVVANYSARSSGNWAAHSLDPIEDTARTSAVGASSGRMSKPHSKPSKGTTRRGLPWITSSTGVVARKL
jgi:hypothetical protein